MMQTSVLSGIAGRQAPVGDQNAAVDLVQVTLHDSPGLGTLSVHDRLVEASMIISAHACLMREDHATGLPHEIAQASHQLDKSLIAGGSGQSEMKLTPGLALRFALATFDRPLILAPPIGYIGPCLVPCTPSGERRNRGLDDLPKLDEFVQLPSVQQELQQIRLERKAIQ
jgi:hypothetical protein